MSRQFNNLVTRSFSSVIVFQPMHPSQLSQMFAREDLITFPRGNYQPIVSRQKQSIVEIEIKS